MRTAAVHRNERGFGLVETLVVLVLVAILMVTMFSAFFRSQKATHQMTRRVELRQGARGAMQLLERELRMAGSGWGRIKVEGSNNGTPRTLYAVNAGSGGSAWSDSISVIGAWDVGTTLRAAMATTTTAIKCVSGTGFNTGDLVVVTNGSSAHLFQVTSVSSNDLNHATTSIYNVAGGHLGWPPGGYGIGAQVLRTTWVSYRIDSTTFGRPALVRRVAGGAPALLAYDASALRVWYRLVDGSETRSPAVFDQVESILPVLYTVGDAGDPFAAPDSSWAAVRPRSF